MSAHTEEARATRADCDYIAIGLPMPMRVFVTLGDLINKAWPGAAIITDPEAAGVPADVIRNLGGNSVWGGRKTALLAVPKRAPKRVSKKAAQQIADANAGEPGEEEPIDFEGISTGEDGDTWLTLAPPEELTLLLGSIGMRILESYEDAINYVEWEVADKEGHRTVLSVARSKGQTPGALRKKAEAENERLRALLRKAGAHVPRSEREFWGEHDALVGEGGEATT